MKHLLLMVMCLLGLQNAANATALTLGQLQAEINKQINSNGHQAITGSTLNGVLIDMTQSLSGAAPAIGSPITGSTAGYGLYVGTGGNAGLLEQFAYGSNVFTAFGNALNGASGLVGYSGQLGTPTQGVLTNATGLPISTGVSGLGAGVAASLANPLPFINAQVSGMSQGGQDNSPYISTLMSKISSTAQGGYNVVFPPVPGQQYTSYYFSSPLSYSRNGTIQCNNSGPRANFVNLVFAAGVDGFINENGQTSADGGNSNTDIIGCGIYSLGHGVASMTAGSTSITGVGMNTIGGIPASTWSIGDGIIAYQQGQPNLAFSGYIAGTTLTVTTINSPNYITVGDPITTSGALKNTIITAFVGGTGGTGTYTVNNSQTVGSSGSPVAFTGSTINPTPMLPSGAYITGVSGSTLTLAGGFAPPIVSSIGGTNKIWQLPVSQKFSVTTASGSDTITITAGPRLLQPGDLIWADFAPFGTTVWTQSGTVGAQTVKLRNYNMTVAQLATATHTSGSGQLWIIPAGIKQRNSARSHKNYVYGFPIGRSMECSGGSTPSMNCDSETNQENSFEAGIIGILTGGNNPNASTSLGETGIHNAYADIVEGGTLANTYIGFTSNSGEEGDAPSGIVGSCVNGNFSGFHGVYMGGTSLPYCLQSSGIGNATLPGSSYVQFFNPQASIPFDQSSVTSTGVAGPFALGQQINSSAGPCMAFPANSGNAVLYFISPDCTSGIGMNTYYNTTVKAFDTYSNGNPNFPSVRQTSGGTYTGYTGDGFTYEMFPRGLLLGNISNSVGQERLLDSGSIAPANSWNLQGDARLNSGAVAGGMGCWFDTASGANAYPGCPISNNQTVPDYTAQTWRLTPVAISALPTCTGGLVATMAVNNGVAVATSGYGVAVSTTGSVVRKVFCDGSTGWVYD